MGAAWDIDIILFGCVRRCSSKKIDMAQDAVRSVTNGKHTFEAAATHNAASTKMNKYKTNNNMQVLVWLTYVQGSS